MKEPVARIVDRRRRRIEGALGSPLSQPHPAHDALSSAEQDHLLGEARNLYWNELEWERITDDEKVDGGALPELAFAGFLAFIRGLLLRDAMPDSLAPANPRPEVVEGVLGFLAERLIELEADSHQSRPEPGAAGDLRLTAQLLDLVLFKLHGLSREEIARVEGRLQQ